jgi:uncharacterized membrane protein YczE
VLIVALAAFGCGEGLLVAAKLGPTPWTVLAQGLSHQWHWSLGYTTLFCSAVVFLGWIPLRQRPGIGSLSNMLIIPIFLQLVSDHLHTPHSWWIRLLLALAGIATVGMGAAFYLTCGLGPGPRDGLMTGLHRVTGMHITFVRIALEVTVLIVGVLLGGTVGLGTLLFAVSIGHVLAWWLGLIVRVTENDPTLSA